MNAKNAASGSAWFDDDSNTPLIADQAQRLESFLAAVADGRIDQVEIEAQEKRVVDLMREIEPQLDASLHAKVTRLLCELTAYDLMQMMHALDEARPKTAFRG